jgi:hypothetical protein
VPDVDPHGVLALLDFRRSQQRRVGATPQDPGPHVSEFGAGRGRDDLFKVRASRQSHRGRVLPAPFIQVKIYPLCATKIGVFNKKYDCRDVQLLVACCVADILRIFAPEAPYKSEDQVRRERPNSVTPKRANRIGSFFRSK